MKEYIVAVVGATGAVGQEMIKTLEQRKFPVKKLVPMASARSAGKKVLFNGEEVTVIELTETAFKENNVEIGLFSAGGSISEKFAPIAAADGVVVIDNTSAFRMDPNVPLVVPEVNPEDIKKHKGIIANPNCSTIQMVVALKAIHDISKVKRVICSTYQAVSGAGYKAISALAEEAASVDENKKTEAKHFPHQIAFNLIPQIDSFMENGYTKEEWKMVQETKKIMGDDNIAVTVTCVRVPVFMSHSETVNVETERALSLAEINTAFQNMEGITVCDNPEKLEYPMPINIAGKDDVYVGRIRKDNTNDKCFNMWVVSDNLRKGAALNAVQIAEKL